uniref:Chalcone-flavonone isomerase family protein n=1 Tax=Tradescantia hirsutiflora TaxID=428262 RepID=A0A1D8BEK8_9LILI|nr:chalcone-flavanone isomerase CHI2a [Tradescantia hirsutiflora]
MGHIATPGHNVHGIEFPGAITPPGSTQSLFLAGAGPRGLKLGDQFIVFTAIALYLHDKAVQSLAPKWKGKSADELNQSEDFYHDIYAGNFQRLTRVSLVNPLTGPEYAAKVTENCIIAWKAAGVYSDDKAHAIEQFREAFKDQNFPHGASILFEHSPEGKLIISFSQDATIPTKPNAEINNGAISQAVLQSIIGDHGVSPETRRNLAVHLSEIFAHQDTYTREGIEL